MGISSSQDHLLPQLSTARTCGPLAKALSNESETDVSNTETSDDGSADGDFSNNESDHSDSNPFSTSYVCNDNEARNANIQNEGDGSADDLAAVSSTDQNTDDESTRNANVQNMANGSTDILAANSRKEKTTEDESSDAPPLNKTRTIKVLTDNIMMLMHRELPRKWTRSECSTFVKLYQHHSGKTSRPFYKDVETSCGTTHVLTVFVCSCIRQSFHLTCFLSIPSCPGTKQQQTQIFIRKLRQEATVANCAVLLEAFTSWTKEADKSLINQYRVGAISDIKIDNKSMDQIKYRLDALITSGSIQQKTFTSWTEESENSLINQYRVGAISDIKIDDKSMDQIKYRLDALMTSGTIQRKARLYKKSAEKLRSIPQQNSTAKARGVAEAITSNMTPNQKRSFNRELHRELLHSAPFPQVLNPANKLANVHLSKSIHRSHV